MNIGEAAKASGVSAKMIRHYEAIGLVPRAGRTLSNYRVYSERDVHVLRFIRRARDLGFGMREIGELVALWANRRRSSAAVRKLALAQLEGVEARIRGLKEVAATLANLVEHCHGDERPDCPILHALAEETG